MVLSVSSAFGGFLKSFRPSSILQLTITGYVAITILLVTAFVIMANQFDKFSKRSEEMITKTARAIRAGSDLIEQTIAMERNARQYLILGDDELLVIYSGRRDNLIQTADGLLKLEISPAVNAGLNKLLTDENKVYESLKRSPKEENVASVYPALLKQSYTVLYAIDDWINSQLSDQRLQTDKTRRILIFQVLLFLAVALILAALFTVLITRPLRQIDHIINRLGSGRFDEHVQIQGPRDLQELGQRLDWLRNRLNDLEQQRTFFMHHVSHELKTPLASIQEGTALLDEGVVGNFTEEQRDIINILRKNCRRLQELIENLLRYNVESLSVLKPMPHPVKLDEVIDRVITDYSLAIKTGNISIVRNIEKVVVHSDLEQIRVVLDNLISNAIKYSPHDGRISIDLRSEAETAVLEIRDEGPGIPREERETVFEPYYQGRPPAGKQSLHGTGLGLAISREYIELNKGTIEVMDTDRGACIQVRIPIRQAENK